MSPKQRDLLYALHNNGGSILGSDLTKAMRSVASRITWRGWVDWERPKPSGKFERNLNNWRLHITDKGRNMIGVQPNAAAKLEEAE
jgi:hypothetical protein